MQLKPLANTGILVPEICLGTMTFGEQNTQAEAFQQLEYALDQGLFFGTRLKCIRCHQNLKRKVQLKPSSATGLHSAASEISFLLLQK